MTEATSSGSSTSGSSTVRAECRSRHRRRRRADRPSATATRVAPRSEGIPVNDYVKLGGRAAVIVVAVVGYDLLPGSSTGSAGRPTAVPKPSPRRRRRRAAPPHQPLGERRVPAVVHAAAAEPGSCPQAARRPGRFRAGSTFTVPTGWVNDGDYRSGDLLPVPGHARQPGRVRSLRRDRPEAILTDRVSTTTCSRAMRPGVHQGATAAEMVAAVVANDPQRSAFWRLCRHRSPIDVTIGGLTGSRSTSSSIPTGRQPGSTRTTRRRATSRTHRNVSCSTPPAGGVIVIFLGSSTRPIRGIPRRRDADHRELPVPATAVTP